VSVLFKDGSSREFDFVVASDGIHSLFRQTLVPNSQPRYAGYTCWRGLTDNAPDGFDRHEAFETWGSGKRFGVVPLPKNRIYWYATVNAPPEDPTFRRYGLKELQRVFQQFHAPVPQIISSTPKESIIQNDIIDVKPITRFAFDRIVLSGDAAHATTPNMGQGACMAIEDAAVLANCIGTTHDVQEAFRKYEQLRVGRTTRIVNTSYTLGKIGQWGNPLLVGLRNKAMQLTPQRVSDNQLEFLFNVSLGENA
jgi:2-polyprenyl-6-methoxyphenol hydroxylase-like FAD-dependent oxidoreductase